MWSRLSKVLRSREVDPGSAGSCSSWWLLGGFHASRRIDAVRHCYDGTKRRDATVDDRDVLAKRFEENRAHLQGVAYRMLGSLSEAEDAVQEAWLRLSRTDTSGVENLRGWLTTVVARVCLDFLRSHKTRREESLDAPRPTLAEMQDGSLNPENEALLAESVGLALLVVLETLAPAERLAFVLHDMFDVPF